jgi:hypothetical protein
MKQGLAPMVRGPFLLPAALGLRGRRFCGAFAVLFSKQGIK